MSRTYGGYLFKCKVCGEVHLLDAEKLHRVMNVPCIRSKYAVRKYKKSDFEPWHGLYFDVSDIIVKEAKKKLF